MKPGTGPIISRVGMAIEAVFVLGLLLYSKRTQPVRLAGIDLWFFLAAGLTTGFCVWIAGWFIVLWRRVSGQSR